MSVRVSLNGKAVATDDCSRFNCEVGAVAEEGGVGTSWQRGPEPSDPAEVPPLLSLVFDNRDSHGS